MTINIWCVCVCQCKIYMWYFIRNNFELCICLKVKRSSFFLNVHSIHELQRTIKNSPLQNCVFLTRIDKNGAIGRSAIVDFLLNLGVVVLLAEITWERNELSPQSQTATLQLISDPYCWKNELSHVSWSWGTEDIDAWMWVYLNNIHWLLGNILFLLGRRNGREEKREREATLPVLFFVFYEMSVP